MSDRSWRGLWPWPWWPFFFRVGVAAVLYLNPALFLGDGSVPYEVQSFATRVASRNVGTALLLLLALWRREGRVLGYLFLGMAVVEIQDFFIGMAELARGENATFAWPVLIFIVLFLWAAWHLLRAEPLPRSQTPHPSGGGGSG